MKLNVLLIDDSKIFLKGLKLLLETNPKIGDIHLASTIDETLEILKSTDIRLAIVDLELSSNEFDGFIIIEEIKTKYPFLKTIVLTFHLRVQYIKRLFDELNVDGYISKQVESDELFNAIEAISNNEKYMDHEIRRILARGFWKKFSERECEVMEMLSNGLIKKQIAEKLSLSVFTIESHVSNLKEKMEVSNTPELVAKYVTYKNSYHEYFEDRTAPFQSNYPKKSGNDKK